MRSREEIKADFERASPKDVLLTNEKEYLNWQRQKLLLEAIQNLAIQIEALLEHNEIVVYESRHL